MLTTQASINRQANQTDCPLLPPSGQSTTSSRSRKTFPPLLLEVFRGGTNLVGAFLPLYGISLATATWAERFSCLTSQPGAPSTAAQLVLRASLQDIASSSLRRPPGFRSHWGQLSALLRALWLGSKCLSDFRFIMQKEGRGRANTDPKKIHRKQP